MTHSSGLPHRIHGPPADVFERALHEAPVLFDPGTGYAYSGSAYAALAYAVTAALQQTPHRDILTLLRERVMAPLGVPNVDWSIGYGTSVEMDGMAFYAAWGGGSYTARATARIGQLLLQRGIWSGEPLLREDCIDRTVSFADTPLADAWREWHHPAPAAGWWSNSEGAWPSLPKDAFAGIGAGHQVLLIVPSLELVVVRFGRELGQARWGGEFWIALERFLLEPIVQAIRRD